MAGMGPPPKPGARVRGPGIALLTLPAEGRDGPTPKWPIVNAKVRAQQIAEMSLWDELWRTPQSILWEQQAIARVVAQYVRWKILAEAGSLEAGKEARQYEDRLLLSPLAMVRARVRIAVDEVGAKRAEKSEDQAEPVRARLRAVE